MDKLIFWLKKETVIHFEFYGNMPFARVGWVWVIIAFFFGYHYFGMILCILFSIIMIYNLLNRRW